MIEVLADSIVAADRLHQKRAEIFLQCGSISRINGFLNRDRCCLRYNGVQFLENFFVIYECDLLVRQGNLTHEIPAEGRLGFNDFQISRNKQEAVYR